MSDKCYETRLTPQDAAEQLIGIYPTITASDPQIYAAGLVHMFSQYPVHLVRAAIDPSSGLPSLHDFPPSMKQVKDFLEPRAKAERETNERIARANRKRIAAPAPDPEAERRIASGLNDLVNHLKSGFGPSTSA